MKPKRTRNRVTQKDFAEAIQHHAVDAGVEDTLWNVENPPGRAPSAYLVSLNKWWVALSAEDRQVARELLRLAARTVAFGYSAIVDGVRSTELPFERFEIHGRREDGSLQRIDDDDGPALHDFFAGDPE